MLSGLNHKSALGCLNFPCSRQLTSCYKLLLGQFWAEELAPSFKGSSPIQFLNCKTKLHKINNMNDFRASLQDSHFCE